MTWAGTGVLWTIAGGVPASLGLVERARRREPQRPHLPADQRQPYRLRQAGQSRRTGTLEEAIDKIKALPVKPAFMIHTGDITHLSKDKEFDDADAAHRRRRGCDAFYVPGEHDVIDEDGEALPRSATARARKGAGWYSFDPDGVHFIGLVNVVNLKAGGLGKLGAEQLDWLADDLARPRRRARRSSSSPTSRSGRSIREWGWGTEDARAGARHCSSASAR